MFVSSLICLIIGAPKYTHVQSSHRLETDFPPMANSMDGTCVVTALWTRAVTRRELRRDVCYDQWIAEFAWSGGPMNDPAKPDIVAGEIETRIDSGCARGCDRYGGWYKNYRASPTLDNSSVTDAWYENSEVSAFETSALSQAWQIKRCEECLCAANDPSDDDDTDDPNFEDGGLKQPTERRQAAGIAVGASITCRMPAGDKQDLSSVYDCPGENYNSLCARLGDLAQIELDEYGSQIQKIVIAGAVLFPLGTLGCFLCVLPLLYYGGAAVLRKMSRGRSPMRATLRKMSRGRSPMRATPASPPSSASPSTIVVQADSVDAMAVGRPQRPSDASVRRLQKKVRMPTLEDAVRATELHWGGKGLDAEDAKVVAYVIAASGSLTVLELHLNGIGVEGAKAIADAVAASGSLAELRLFENNIGDEGAKALAAAVAASGSLATLSIGNNNIGNEGAKAIAEAVRASGSLATLELWGNKIGYEGAKALAAGVAASGSLATLELSGNKIGYEGAKALASAVAASGSLALKQLYVGSTIRTNADLVAACQSKGVRLQ